MDLAIQMSPLPVPKPRRARRQRAPGTGWVVRRQSLVGCDDRLTVPGVNGGPASAMNSG